MLRLLLSLLRGRIRAMREEQADHEDLCDHCHGPDAYGPMGLEHCACAAGLGAAPENCQCRPPMS